MDIKKETWFFDYILECNKDFDTFFERHLSEVQCMDINQLEIVVFHVTINGDGCVEIEKNGLSDLKRVLQEKTELNSFLCGERNSV